MFNNILYKFKFGSRNGYSISYSIISLVEKINKVLSSGKNYGGSNFRLLKRV